MPIEKKKSRQLKRLESRDSKKPKSPEEGHMDLVNSNFPKAKELLGRLEADLAELAFSIGCRLDYQPNGVFPRLEMRPMTQERFNAYMEAKSMAVPKTGDLLDPKLGIKEERLTKKK